MPWLSTRAQTDASVLFSQRRGLVYASVHDSYWTHACDVDEMSAALRDCFIELHSRDLLGELKSGFQERYKGYVIRQKAMKGLHIEGQEASDKENGQSAARSALMDLGDIAAEYGPSALPPLAVAGDEKLLAELRDREKKAGSSTTDAELEEVEEDMFRDEEEESEMDADAEIEPQGEAEEPEVVEAPKRGKGRPPKSTVASAKDSTASKSKGKSKSKKAKTHKETESLTSTVFPGSKTRVIELSSAFPEIPPRGDFDLEMIRHSPYFFN